MYIICFSTVSKFSKYNVKNSAADTMLILVNVYYLFHDQFLQIKFHLKQ